MSFSCSETCLRRRISSVRSAAVSGASPVAAAASMRRRSSATHLPSRVSARPSSRLTSAMVRPESITLWAASTLYSVVNDRRVRDMVTSSQRDRLSRYLDVHYSGGTSHPLVGGCTTPTHHRPIHN